MKYLLLLITTIIVNISYAQLVYIGDDEIQERYYDGYIRSRKTIGFVTLHGKHYFVTPNGNVFQTEGAVENTKIIKQFEPQNEPFLKATNKYVYFAYNVTAKDLKELVRYNTSKGIGSLESPYKRNAYFPVEARRSPATDSKYLASEIFVNYDKDALLVRSFETDAYYVFKIDDANEKNEASWVAAYDVDVKNISLPIYYGTSIETFNNEVYFNGLTKPTGTYETSVRVFKPSDIGYDDYKVKYNFEIKKYYMYPYLDFFRTEKHIYSFIKVQDSVTKEIYHNLYYFDNAALICSKLNLTNKAVDFKAEKIGEDIYVSYKGDLWKFNEEKDGFDYIILGENTDLPWDDIAKDKRFLKVNEYYMYRRGGKLWIYNEKNKATTEVTKEALAKNPNYFTLFDTYAYSGKNCFYFTQYINSKQTFIQYNPATNSYSPIVFPSFKKQDFEEIKAIYYENGKFIFLTSYKGKKDKPVYKMFMYTEESGVISSKTN